MSPRLAPLALVDVPAVAALAYANAAHIGVGMREPPKDLHALLTQVTRLRWVLFGEQIVDSVWWPPVARRRHRGWEIRWTMAGRDLDRSGNHAQTMLPTLHCAKDYPSGVQPTAFVR